MRRRDGGGPQRDRMQRLRLIAGEPKRLSVNRIRCRVRKRSRRVIMTGALTAPRRKLASALRWKVRAPCSLAILRAARNDALAALWLECGGRANSSPHEAR